jgi:hypothetical protein
VAETKGRSLEDIESDLHGAAGTTARTHRATRETAVSR